MIDTKEHPAITEIILRFRKLQEEVQCATQVRDWLISHAQLLREVSMALGFICAAKECYEHSAAVYSFQMGKIESLGADSSNEWYLDEFLQENQVEAKCRYHTDLTINLPLIFSNIPELGLMADFHNWEPHASCEHLLNFKPTAWKFSANLTLFHAPHFSESEAALFTRLLGAVYPATTLDRFTAMYDAGLFADIEALTHWLDCNERNRSGEHTEPLVSVPTDFAP